MKAPAIFRWNGPDNERFQGQGVTRDMSITGAFILSATCPPPNAAVKMEALLPLSDGLSKAQMKADMKVLRVDYDITGNKHSGFSAVCKEFLLSTFSNRASQVVVDLIKAWEKIAKDQE